MLVCAISKSCAYQITLNVFNAFYRPLDPLFTNAIFSDLSGCIHCFFSFACYYYDVRKNRTEIKRIISTKFIKPNGGESFHEQDEENEKVLAKVAQVTEDLIDVIRKHDLTCDEMLTIASRFMAWATANAFHEDLAAGLAAFKTEGVRVVENHIAYHEEWCERVQ